MSPYAKSMFGLKVHNNHSLSVVPLPNVARVGSNGAMPHSVWSQVTELGT